MLIHTGADSSLDKHVAEVSRAVFSNQGSHYTSLLSSQVFKGMSTLVIILMWKVEFSYLSEIIQSAYGALD